MSKLQQPHLPGHLTADEAIADIMQTTGMTRRNAVRWLRKKVAEGRIHTVTIDQRTMKRVEKTPQQVAESLAAQNPEAEH